MNLQTQSQLGRLEYSLLKSCTCARAHIIRTHNSAYMWRAFFTTASAKIKIKTSAHTDRSSCSRWKQSSFWLKYFEKGGLFVFVWIGFPSLFIVILLLIINSLIIFLYNPIQRKLYSCNKIASSSYINTICFAAVVVDVVAFNDLFEVETFQRHKRAFIIWLDSKHNRQNNERSSSRFLQLT